MKKLIIFSILIFGVFLAGCEKDKAGVLKENFKFEATVLGQGPDCGDTFLISLKNIDTDSDFEDGIYYAENLESEFKVEDLKIYLNCRELNVDEGYVCSTLGPYFPHLWVINSAKAE